MTVTERNKANPLSKVFWAEKDSKPKSTKEYVPLEEREDQSWRKNVIVLASGQK